MIRHRETSSLSRPMSCLSCATAGWRQPGGKRRVPGRRGTNARHRSAAAVRAVMQFAAAPVPLGLLAGALTTRFPSAPPEAIRDLLDGLTAEGFLVTSAQPPLTAGDPLESPRDALRAAGAGQVPRTAEVLRELDEISALMVAHNTCTRPTPS